MGKVRLLVGPRKGAFVLTSNARRERWDISGPHFGGWEIYHLKGSPADPNRLSPQQHGGAPQRLCYLKHCRCCSMPGRDHSRPGVDSGPRRSSH
jgi:hypothetical protein